MNWTLIAYVWFSYGGPDPGYRAARFLCDEKGCNTQNAKVYIPSCTDLQIQDYTPTYFFLEPYLVCEPYDLGAIVRVEFKQRNP